MCQNPDPISEDNSTPTLIIQVFFSGWSFFATRSQGSNEFAPNESTKSPMKWIGSSSSIKIDEFSIPLFVLRHLIGRAFAVDEYSFFRLWTRS